MKPHAIKHSRFYNSIANARIGQAFRQKWKPFWRRHARVYVMFKAARAYNEWQLNRLIAEARRKKRRLSQPGGDSR